MALIRMPRSRNARRYLRSYGWKWTSLRLLAWAPNRISALLDRRVERFEKERGLTGTGTKFPYSSVANREYWEKYDWRDDGREWTRDVVNARGLDHAKWESMIVENVIFRYAEPGSTILEIGPGSGRWSALIQPTCGRLILADISTACIALCRSRFADCDNVEYHIMTDGTLEFLPDASVDSIWSYGVFVLFDVPWAERYIAECARVLAPGGYAMLHHRDGLRYILSAASLRALAVDNGLEPIIQDFSLAAVPGEVISVIRKPTGETARSTRST